MLIGSGSLAQKHRFSRGGLSPLNVPGVTAYWNAGGNYPSTLVDGAISSLPDLTINGNTASQSTAASRPYLSGPSNVENCILQSEALATSPWVAQNVTPANSGGVSPSGKNWCTLTNAATTSVHYVYQSAQIAPTRIVYETEYQISDPTLQYLMWAQDLFWCFFNSDGTFNLAFNSNGSGVATTEDLGNGVYKATVSYQAATSVTAVNCRIGIGKGNSTSYLGAITESIKLTGLQVRRLTTASTYQKTTTFPVWAAVNGNRVPVFDGVDDALTTSRTVNPTGGMCGIIFVQPNAMPAEAVMLRARPADATARLNFVIEASGRIYGQIMNGSTNYIGRYSTAGDVVVNQPCVLSFTYDGGTSNSGVKLYKNLSRIDSADLSSGVYTVPTAGATLRIGSAEGSSALFKGYLSPAIFLQGSVISDANHLGLVRATMDEFGIV